MKTLLSSVFCLFILFSNPLRAQPRQRLSFNADWRFHLGEPDNRARGEKIEKWRWKMGQAPADATSDTSGTDWQDAGANFDPFNKTAGFVWFRTTLPAQDAKQISILDFSGVDDNATVFLDGQQVRHHEGWAESFEVPVKGQKELAVLVENQMGPGGIGEVFLRQGLALTPPFAQNTFDDTGWRKLDLPHDWGIEGPFQQELPGETGKLPWAGIGWYRKTFEVEKADEGHQFSLEIDGAMSYSTVWMNGQSVGGWPYGYASYQLDLTPFLKFGAKNVLAIRLDNLPNSSRWYPGGGIYRNVWLSETGPLHVAHWGVKITTPEISPEKATVKVAVEIEKPAGAIAVRTDIFAQDAKGQKSGSLLARTQTTATEGDKQELSLKILNPRLWDTKKPNLYLAVTSLLRDGKIVDSVETSFGVRTIEWTVSNGFLLNGQRVPIQGVCMHHDLGALGAAINTRALERQLEILQEMGCNAIRTSHNPPAPELLDLCDRHGIMVMDEFSDTWKAAKKPNGYARLFDQWAEKDLRAMIRRDRNHPCVILWSTGNEVGEQYGGFGVSQFLTDIVHSEDSTRPATSGNSAPEAGFNGFQKTNDVFGYNYKPGLYAKFRAQNPTIPIFGSETASCISSRGEYVFPVSDDQNAGHSDFQVSSYDLSAPGWAMPPDREFRGQDENPFVAGEFVWTGFDYLGEPTPYNSDSTNLLNYHTPEARAVAEKQLKELGKIPVPSRSSYFGIVDLAGFKKDRFYLYQARWRPDFPMAHILPHWNWPERVGQVTPVHVYTSGDEAELFLNGQSLGRKQKEKYQYRLRWDNVVYEPGELRVVAYKNGQKWAEAMVKTTGAATKLVAQADRAAIAADGKDLSFITVSVCDKEGQMVPRSKNALKFETTGPGEIVATDNGDATDHTSFQSRERRAYNGLALVIVRAKKTGATTLKISGEGVEGTQITITSRESR